MCSQLLVLLLAVAAVAHGAVIESKPCSGKDDTTAFCTIPEVSIDPCNNPAMCKIKRKTNSSISFEFVPNFSTSDLNTMVYWDNGVKDIEFRDLGSPNACSYTTCPTVAGQSQVFNYRLYISKFTPTSSYDLKWKVWNPNNEDQRCCFTFKIKIVK